MACRSAEADEVQVCRVQACGAQECGGAGARSARVPSPEEELPGGGAVEHQPCPGHL